MTNIYLDIDYVKVSQYQKKRRLFVNKYSIVVELPTDLVDIFATRTKVRTKDLCFSTRVRNYYRRTDTILTSVPSQSIKFTLSFFSRE